MTFDKHCRVDVNTATGSYTVDDTGQNMEQEPTTQPTVELIVIRRCPVFGDEMPPLVIPEDDKVRYHFPMSGVVRIVKRTTIDEVLFSDTPSTIANLPSTKPRKPRKKETEPRAVCRSRCCGAHHRRKSSIDGFCFDCRPSNSFNRREEVKQ